MLKKEFMIMFVVFAFIGLANADQNKTQSTEIPKGLRTECSQEAGLPPILKNGKKFRVSVIRSGEYWQYAANLKYQLNSLMEYGWINKIQLSADALKTVPGILKELRKQKYSDYIEFPPELYFDFEFKEEKVTDPRFQKIIKDSKNVDLIISLGTRSARVLSSLKSLSIPVIAVQISDPLKAGIIKSCEDSGNDYLTARCDLDKYKRQIKVFYDVINFKKLGLIYEDTPVGKSIAALDHIESLAKEKGFDIISNTKPVANGPEAPKEYLAGIKELAPKIDAMYFTIHGGFKLKNLQDIMAIMNKHNIPTFAMEGPKFVKHGVLLSLSSQEQRASGKYNAQKIICILKGSTPRQLNQKFTISPMIAINLKEAMQIGYDPPIDILAVSDEVYEEIQEPVIE